LIVVFQPTATADVRWFSRYYHIVFKAGELKGKARLAAMLKVLAANPNIGHLTGPADEREIFIPKTPFSLIYRLRGDRIEILRLWDLRRDSADKVNWN
jgi:plasmid stabilization system protein ParE